MLNQQVQLPTSIKPTLLLCLLKVQSPVDIQQLIDSSGTRCSGTACCAAAAADSEVLTLQQWCMAAVEATLQPATVCTVLAIADVVRPSADALRAAALAFIAERLPDVIAGNKAGVQALSFDCMLELLQHRSLVSTGLLPTHKLCV